ncbi:hypothetical protein [Aurantiacibacter rhizosphaerae]|uniref:Uncharacterized protein n=1 Tax=Aurantiacibacter rhizosphaerae TaxID=2691582 RepID=A0A844XFI9_9SPHN|nr:hypothetical protein [Aurantiacibacter rhizosphaerae]MWV28364.1 hypothetical protein [Aurantiacibacter rhizosphaerae]
MMKLLVGAVAGVVGFLAAFSFTASDEIGAAVDADLQSNFVARCVVRIEQDLDTTRAPDICKCMETEFANNGLKLTDALGDDLARMQDITRSCAGIYG